jgi:hypothetical protein
MLISDKTDFKLKLVRKDEDHFKLIKETIYQEEIIFNIYVPNVRMPNFIKQTLLDYQTQTDPNTIIIGHFNTPHSQIDRSSRTNKKNQQRNSRVK